MFLFSVLYLCKHTTIVFGENNDTRQINEPDYQNMTKEQLIEIIRSQNTLINYLQTELSQKNNTVQQLTNETKEKDTEIKNLKEELSDCRDRLQDNNITIYYLTDKLNESQSKAEYLYTSVGVNMTLGDPRYDYLVYFDPKAINPNAPRGAWFQYWDGEYRRVQYDEQGIPILYYGKSVFVPELNMYILEANMTVYFNAMRNKVVNNEHTTQMATWAFPISFTVFFFGSIVILSIIRKRQHYRPWNMPAKTWARINLEK